MSEESLVVAGVGGGAARKLAKAAEQNAAQIDRLGDEQLLSGFYGNNGGEEFLSYLMTSESLVIAAKDEFTPGTARWPRDWKKCKTATAPGVAATHHQPRVLHGDRGPVPHDRERRRVPQQHGQANQLPPDGRCGQIISPHAQIKR